MVHAGGHLPSQLLGQPACSRATLKNVLFLLVRPWFCVPSTLCKGFFVVLMLVSPHQTPLMRKDGVLRCVDCDIDYEEGQTTSSHPLKGFAHFFSVNIESVLSTVDSKDVVLVDCQLQPMTRVVDTKTPQSL